MRSRPGRGARPTSRSWHRGRHDLAVRHRRGAWRGQRGAHPGARAGARPGRGARARPRPLGRGSRHPPVGAAAPGGGVGGAGRRRRRRWSTSASSPRPPWPTARPSSRSPGVVLSASHNAFADNGVKFFAAGGRKLSDDVEAALEAELAAILAGAATSPAPPSGAAVGTLETDPAATAIYVDHLTHDVLEGRRLNGLRVVIDTANGAACATAPQVLQALGAEVTVLHAQPDGTNINAGCGSTYPGRPAAGGAAAARPPRPGVRRRRRPRPGRRRRGPARRRRSHHRHLRGRPARARPAARRHRGGHRHDQPGVPAGHAGARREGDRDQRRRPPRAGGDGGGRLGARWRAVGPRDLPRPRHHRRRPAHRARSCSTWWPARAVRWPTSRPPP